MAQVATATVTLLTTSPQRLRPREHRAHGAAHREPGAATFVARGLGSAYGIEVYLRRRLTRRLGGYLSYTLSRSVRTAGRTTFPDTFDRTHVLSSAAAYDLGSGWRAGARFTFYTGAPEVSPLAPPSSNPPRDPDFFRIDLRVEKRWRLGKSVWLAAVAEGLNVTAQKEVVGGTPLAPSPYPASASREGSDARARDMAHDAGSGRDFGSGASGVLARGHAADAG